MAIKSGLREIVGKTITSVVVAHRGGNPQQQIFLIFSDDSSLELWGADISCPDSLDKGGVTEAISYAQRSGASIAKVYPEQKS